MKVEGQEVVVPTGVWGADGWLEVPAKDALCSVTVKSGLSGLGGINVVLRVGLAPMSLVGGGRCLARIPYANQDLANWHAVPVRGREECDLGQLPCRPGRSPRVPTPGSCQHEWAEDGWAKVLGRSETLSVEEAMGLGPSACCADFRRGLNLKVEATCVVGEGGQATLRLEVAGELRLQPRFWPGGREGVARLLRQARGLYEEKEATQALQKCEEALVMADALQPRPREMADVLNLMGALHLGRGNTALAVKCLERAVTVREAAGLHGPEEERSLAAALSTLGDVHRSLGTHAKALECYHRSCGLLAAAASSGLDPIYAGALHGLAGELRALGRHAEARKCYERALEIRTQALGADHVLTGATLNNLGATLQALADDRAAIRCYQRALAIETVEHGRESLNVAITLSNLGSAHGRLGEHRCARECHGQALEVLQRKLGAEHPRVAATLHNYGNVLAAGGKGADAARCYWRALAIWSRSPSGVQADIAATLHSLGNVYRGLQDPEAAAQCFAGALRIRESVLGPAHPETARTRHGAALARTWLGEPEAAMQELQSALNSLQQHLGKRHPWSLQALADSEALQATTEAVAAVVSARRG